MAHAQSSLDVLERDLEQLKQEHQEASTRNFSSFLSALDNATASPDAAVQLYEAAGGTPPAMTPVKTKYEHETPTEKAARQAKDRQIVAGFGAAVQLHCGLMRFAALFVAQPDAPSLQDDWTAWLKNAGTVYPQVAGETDILGLAVSKSPIGPYLGFKAWGKSEQGAWSLKGLPELYRAQILDPLRKSPTEATLAAWDIYIAMKSADEPDQEKWSRDEYPDLLFERDSDDCAASPSTDKIETLMGIIKANSMNPKADQWISRVHDMMQSYRAQLAASPATSGAGEVQPDVIATNNTPVTVPSPTPSTNAITSAPTPK